MNNTRLVLTAVSISRGASGMMMCSIIYKQGRKEGSAVLAKTILSILLE